ncbi:MAG: hypothetical protein MZV65_13885 [Chromatiales bacterium]|nr:hypothetical protein [Chromatiales bacterium]
MPHRRRRARRRHRRHRGPRLVGEAWPRSWGNPVIVDNKPGAAGHDRDCRTC